MMSETLTPTNGSFEAPIKNLDSELIVAGVENIGISIKSPTEVAQNLSVLNHEFGISAEAYEDTTTSILLTGVAELTAELEARKEGMTIGQYGAEMEYVADLVMGIAGEHTVFSEQHEEGLKQGGFNPSDEHMMHVLDKYSQPELSKGLSDHIAGEALDGVRAAIGIDKSMESPFEVRVLSIGDDSAEYGLIPSINWEDQKIDTDEEIYIREKYKKDMNDRADSFNSELGRSEGFAPAWVMTFDDGKRVLCVTSGFAEKILYPEEDRAEYYDDRAREGDVALLEHEYTHTQQAITTKAGIGISLEELRAEYFSGNKHGYIDVKRTVNGIRAVTGVSVEDSFVAAELNSRDSVITDLAKTLGLQNTLDLMAAIPSNYASDEKVSPFIRGIVNHNGGLSGSLKRIYDRTLKEQGAEIVESRVSGFIDRLHRSTANSKYVTVESWLNYGGNTTLASIGMENYRRRYPQE